VLVKRVFTDSPAEAAGIKDDDIIVAIDGMAVRDVADLTSYLGEYKSPDEEATLELIRDTTKMELSVEIGKRE
jgi:S1-C subfamily serine protease